MPDETKDSFTVTDRRELMRQGLQLDLLIAQVKAAGEAYTLQVADHERRIRSLEETRVTLTAQLKTVMGWLTFFAAVIGSGAHFLWDILLGGKR